jgi:FkbM family methyltransferase
MRAFFSKPNRQLSSKVLCTPVTINYIDVGLHEGNEISMFLCELEGLPNTQLRIYGIEANPRYAEYCKKRYIDDDRVTIENFAVGLGDGVCRLYLDNDVGEGSSLYDDKVNVTSKYVEVPKRPLSEWLSETGIIPKPKLTINIMRANIEGAEWEVIRDFDEKGVFSEFDLFCGSHRSWLADMHKIPSLRDRIKEAKSILKRNKVKVHVYIGESRTYGASKCMKKNIQMRKQVSKLIQKVNG